MYRMYAEHVQAGTQLLWHAVDRNGNTPCRRMLTKQAAPLPEGVRTCEEYCRGCMDAVAAAAPSCVPTGRAVRQNAGDRSLPARKGPHS